MRLAHAENNDEATLKSFANAQVAAQADAHFVTDRVQFRDLPGCFSAADDENEVVANATQALAF